MGNKSRARKPIVQSTPTKGTETQENHVQAKPAKKSKPKYWKNPTFLNGRTISGLVTEEDKAEYIETVKNAMPAEEFEDWDFNTKVSDVDLEAERRTEAIAKQRKKLGLA